MFYLLFVYFRDICILYYLYIVLYYIIYCIILYRISLYCILYYIVYIYCIMCIVLYCIIFFLWIMTLSIFRRGLTRLASIRRLSLGLFRVWGLLEYLKVKLGKSLDLPLHSSIKNYINSHNKDSSNPSKLPAPKAKISGSEEIYNAPQISQAAPGILEKASIYN